MEKNVLLIPLVKMECRADGRQISKQNSSANHHSSIRRLCIDVLAMPRPAWFQTGRSSKSPLHVGQLAIEGLGGPQVLQVVENVSRDLWPGTTAAAG